MTEFPVGFHCLALLNQDPISLIISTISASLKFLYLIGLIFSFVLGRLNVQVMMQCSDM